MDWVRCFYCKNNFLKNIRHINENKKLNHKFYCSIKCQSLAKNKQKIFICENKDCKNKFKRAPHSTSLHNFCSSSCAAIFNNTLKWGIKIPKKKLSEQDRKRRQKEALKRYWLKYQSKYLQKDVIVGIQKFVNENNRLPVKKELNKIYKPARKYFGTWNNAVEAAGFDPNPVLFAKKQTAKDGHICDSLAEKLIDDYLYEKNIKHERNIPYPEGTYTADFKIGERYIEYFGLANEHDRYDQLRLIKQKLAKRYKIDLTEIYPKDLYSKERSLDKILGI